MRFSLKLAQSAQPDERNSKISTKSSKIRSTGQFLGKTPPMGISSQNSLFNNLSTDSHLQYTDGFSLTSEITRDHQKFVKLHFRGAIGEFPKK
jgi:hypothetical protein